MKPRIHILNPAFQYTPAVATDIRRTFERARQCCTYCGKEVPDSIEPATFVCCGERGHTEAEAA